MRRWDCVLHYSRILTKRTYVTAFTHPLTLLRQNPADYLIRFLYFFRRRDDDVTLCENGADRIEQRVAFPYSVPSRPVPSLSHPTPSAAPNAPSAPMAAQGRHGDGTATEAAPDVPAKCLLAQPGPMPERGGRIHCRSGNNAGGPRGRRAVTLASRPSETESKSEGGPRRRALNAVRAVRQIAHVPPPRPSLRFRPACSL